MGGKFPFTWNLGLCPWQTIVKIRWEVVGGITLKFCLTLELYKNGRGRLISNLNPNFQGSKLKSRNTIILNYAVRIDLHFFFIFLLTDFFCKLRHEPIISPIDAYSTGIRRCGSILCGYQVCRVSMAIHLGNIFIKGLLYASHRTTHSKKGRRLHLSELIVYGSCSLSIDYIEAAVVMFLLTYVLIKSTKLIFFL